jgi:glucose/arabinose dehydrogenase
VRPLGEPVVIASGLDAPWSILRLPGGATLISERDTALIRELLPDGSLRDAARLDGVRPNGEGGLLGLAHLPADEDSSPDAGGSADGWVYAYLTTASDNRIVRMPLTGATGNLGLGPAEDVLTGIPSASVRTACSTPPRATLAPPAMRKTWTRWPARSCG